MKDNCKELPMFHIGTDMTSEMTTQVELTSQEAQTSLATTEAEGILHVCG